MARARNIKPGYMQNDELAECGMDAHLLFACLWMIADKEGRFKDRPKRIKAQCLPYYDEACVNVDACLDRLQAKGFVRRYEIDGERFCQIANWHKHQSPHHKEADSELPPPPKAHCDSQGQTKVEPMKVQSRSKHELSLLQASESENQTIRQSGIKKSGIKESDNPESGSTQFNAFWEVWPKKASRADAEKAWQKAIKSELPEVIIAAATRYSDSYAATDHPMHAATFLNKERWKDDPQAWQAPVRATFAQQATNNNRDVMNRFAEAAHA